MKKFTAILLAVVMVFALGASAFAADTNDTLSSFTFTDFNLTVSVSTTNEGLVLNGTAGNRGISLAADTGRDIPQSFSLIFSNANGTNFDTSSVTVTTSYAATFAFYEDAEQEPGQPTRGYGIVALNGDQTTITITRTGVDGQCSISVPAPTAQVAGQGLVAFLPAPGQFVNEGAAGSGWGGPFTAADKTTLKNLVEGYVTTGVSLGSFGGYAVLDFGAITRDASGAYVSGGIYNDPANAYGVDFTLFGNAMSTWAEPGCVQVSQDGVNWYDIAGSLHYQTPSDTAGGAIWDYSATYTNPVAADDDLASGKTGTAEKAVTWSASYKTRPTSSATPESGSVAYNNWHKHSYFPLFNNYFASPKTGASALDGLLNTVPAGLNFTGKFGAYTAKSGTTASTLMLKGVKLVPPKTNNANSTAPDDFLFGYFDCHPNGLRSGAQVNPYTTGRTGNDNSNGDPIDISWAVYPAGRTDTAGNDISGNPANLDAIRYVRCYTGVMQMNGIMGESSSELLGSHKATTKGTGAATTDLELWGQKKITTSNMAVVDVTARPYTIYSSEAHVFVNGSAVDASGENGYTFSIASGEKVQIITQNGTESPYIVVLSCS